MVGALIDVAAESISIIYEAWLRNNFAVTTVMLASAAWVFSAAEVSGEGLVIGIADRFGKRRLLIVAIVATGVIYLLLPILAINEPTAIALLFLMFFCFEVSVVVSIPMATEALPQARGLMMSSNVAFFAVGRAVGTLLGGWMFRTGGMGLNTTCAALLSFISAALVWRYVTEHR
jgi:predicted MFS family arabinose efflux permease